MVINKHKGFILKHIFFKSEEEYNDLIQALDTNDKEKVLDILFTVKLRGDL